jgi:hypothetical protein
LDLKTFGTRCRGKKDDIMNRQEVILFRRADGMELNVVKDERGIAKIRVVNP